MKINSKTKRAIISVASLAAVAAINYTVVHNPIVFFLTFVLMVHELGHYLFAKFYGAKVQYPFFIPFILFSLGVTQVENLPDEYKHIVAAAGPVVASLAIVIFMLLNLYVKIYSTKVLSLILFGEVVYNFFGSDGKKYRKAKATNQTCLIS